MKSIAIHQKDDWYLVNLPGFGDIPHKQIRVEVELSPDEIMKNDYKSLRGAVIMERYIEKEARSRVEEAEAGYVTRFDELFDTANINIFDDLLKNI